MPPEPETEQLWEGIRGSLGTDGLVTVLGVPAYIYDVGFGDRFTVMESAEKALVATGKEHDAGNFTFRVLLTSTEGDGWLTLVNELAQSGCLIDVISPRFFAISCGGDLAQVIADRLFALQNSGVLHYETGRTHLPPQ